MKIFIMTDMEGISGVFCAQQVKSGDGHALYHQARKYITWDVNACVQGCFDAGATKVMVRDAHANGKHIIWEDLDERAEYVRGGFSGERMPGIAGFDGLILLGYHAMAGTPEAVLEHTMSSAAWQNFWINGKKAGEIAIDAGIAGDFKVPTIMVSGDDKTCAEAKKLIKGVVTAQVKKGLGVEGAILLSKPVALKRIKDSAIKAVNNCKNIKPCIPSTPVTMRLEVVERGRIPYNKPHVKIIDGHTFEVKGKNVTEAFQNLSR